MSTPFATIPDDGTPLRVVVVGAGGMGRAWLRTVEESPLVELAGIVDLDLDAARAGAASIGRPDLPVGAGTAQLASDVGAQAVINVTIPVAHHPVTTEALAAGLPVLGEKPVASTVAQGLSLAAASELTGQLFMVSQSRRYNRHLFEAKRLASGSLGAVGIVSAEFFKAPHFGGFRDAMDHPLLLDMAIHQFDMARFLLDADPVSVFCEEYNPSWSWYSGDAGATAIFEMTGGERFVFTGSWCSPGRETSWNAAWRISGEHGTVLWDGDNEPILDAELGADASGFSGVAAENPGQEIAGSLRDFVAALRTGSTPMGQVHQNIMSLAMVEAAILSASIGTRVSVDALLEESYAEAVLAERDPAVLEVLKSWTSVRSALAGESVAL
ncbi:MULTISPECIES: Gfo/Idh/MocA family protein [Arthrobacter]|uniref:Gfo/Idh/MocA family oxidoreductase n=1 Tax=Arthrobacter terricola TaxID=2547396 RepID=A0A4R5KGT3_9MICC|nr:MULTISPECIES: Gfo/Idh/MocA family oxidoreductase [Arthrobacter]MBT8162111.1 Gfo/Idh/MocA family oxidoreductase [Arthrobacter sp. GN70]TDF93928.1 Gfo/Idh/MocA family oxidoreductase [Arthrobacter terricola]